jgi:phage-related minor tail protein
MTEPTPDAVTAEDTPTQQAPAVTAEDIAKLQRALDSEREARKNAEKAAREAKQAASAALPEAERMALEAEQRGRAAALTEFGGRLVDAELRAAAAGRPVNVDALLEAVDRGRFITDDGDVDRKALTAWVDRIAPAPTDTGPVIPSFDGGARTTHAPGSTADQFAKTVGALLT